VRAVSTNVAPPRLLFGLPLDAGVDASKNPPCWTDATKIREELMQLTAKTALPGRYRVRPSRNGRVILGLDVRAAFKHFHQSRLTRTVFRSELPPIRQEPQAPDILVDSFLPS